MFAVNSSSLRFRPVCKVCWTSSIVSMHHPFMSMCNLFVNVEGPVYHKLYVDKARLLACEMKKALVGRYKIQNQ